MLTIFPKTYSRAFKKNWVPPGDKSISQRVTILASLSDGLSQITGLLWSEDTISNLKTLKQLGVDITVKDRVVNIKGKGLFGFSSNHFPLNVGNSATTARLLTAILSGQIDQHFEIVGNPILQQRPMSWIVEPLKEMGADIQWLNTKGNLPLRIKGAPLIGAEHRATVSSAQFVSTLMFGSLFANQPTIIYRKTQARDHTERLFHYAGIQVKEEKNYIRVEPPKKLKSFHISVPGDISSAAFCMTLVAMIPYRGVTFDITSVGLNPTRTGFITALKQMGADIEIVEKVTLYGEPVGNIIIRSGMPLKGIKISGDTFVQSLIDEIPLIGVLASTAEGETMIEDASELKDKDTNRILTTCNVLKRFGIEATKNSNGFRIQPGVSKSPGEIQAPNDHRIAMALMVLATRCRRHTIVKNWEVIRVSFPNFLDLLKDFAYIQLDEEQPPNFGPYLLDEVDLI